MTGRAAAWLRWYPPSWRQRYGDELVAFMEDTYGQGRVPWRSRLGLIGGGLVERRRQTFGTGSDDPGTRLRGGALLVLAAWAPFIVAGIIFAKFSEHWTGTVPLDARTVPTVSYDAVVGAAVVGAGVVALGAVLALPAFLRFLAGGGWARLRRPVLGAGGVTLITAAYGAALTAWAHGLTDGQRNGGSWSYSVGFMIGALLVVLTVIAWTAVAVTAAAAVDLRATVLRVEGSLALVLTVVMVGVLAGIVSWWADLAASARGFLVGSPHAWPLPPALVVAGACMAFGAVIAGRGAGRVYGALRLRG
ncbi:MAG: hypothetical protein ACRDY1_11405 [Acidimicrobiales bacterium]